MIKLIFNQLTGVLFFFACSSVMAQNQAPQIKDIRITGNKRINQSVILNRLDSKKNAPYRDPVFQNDLQKILKIYTDKLYFLTTIDSVRKKYSTDSSSVSLEIFITEHKQVIIDTVSVTGCMNVQADILMNQMESASGKIFDPEILNRDIQTLLNYYENGGYPFVSIRISRFTVNTEKDSPKAVLTMDVDEGDFVMLQKIDFTGQKQTQIDVLGRTAGLRFPTPFQQKAIDNSLIRLRKLVFIEEVRGPDIISYNDTIFGLRYDVTEGLSNRFDGIAGYVPGRTNANEKGYLTGMIQLSFMNLFGSARKLDALWQKKNRYSQDFLLAYTEPWVLNYPVEAGVFLQQIVQDTTYVLREYGLNTRTSFFLHSVILAGIKRKSIDPSGSVNSFVFNIPYSAFWTGYFGFEWDSRDDRMNPLTGSYYKATVDYNRQTERSYIETPAGRDTLWIGGNPKTVTLQKSVFSTQKIGMDAEWYVPVHRRWVIYESLHGLFYKTPRAVVPYSEQFLIGGLKTVRGYIQDQFNGSRIAWNNLELRWITSKDSRLFLFADVGYYYRKEFTSAAKTAVQKVTGYPIGYGFGIRFKTRLGLFGMDYGLGKGDSFSTGKIHFGIMSQF